VKDYAATCRFPSLRHVARRLALDVIVGVPLAPSSSVGPREGTATLIAVCPPNVDASPHVQSSSTQPTAANTDRDNTVRRNAFALRVVDRRGTWSCSRAPQAFGSTAASNFPARNVPIARRTTRQDRTRWADARQRTLWDRRR
jgi:hypothetical protein